MMTKKVFSLCVDTLESRDLQSSVANYIVNTPKSLLPAVPAHVQSLSPGQFPAPVQSSVSVHPLIASGISGTFNGSGSATYGYYGSQYTITRFDFYDGTNSLWANGQFRGPSVAYTVGGMNYAGNGIYQGWVIVQQQSTGQYAQLWVSGAYGQFHYTSYAGTLVPLYSTGYMSHIQVGGYDGVTFS